MHACKNFADGPEASGTALGVAPAEGVTVVCSAVVVVSDVGGGVDDAGAEVETDWLDGPGSTVPLSPSLPHAARLNAVAAKTAVSVRVPMNCPLE